jgi:hypothetical protein
MFVLALIAVAVVEVFVFEVGQAIGWLLVARSIDAGRTGKSLGSPLACPRTGPGPANHRVKREPRATFIWRVAAACIPDS